MSLAQALLDLAAQHAGGQRIRSLKVRVGPLSGVVTDSLQFAFELLSQGTLAEGARLDFEVVPMTMTCKACGLPMLVTAEEGVAGNELVLRALEQGCECGSKELKITGGYDFQLVEIEVEQDDE